MMPELTPVVVVTGFLGAGKTSMLNALVRQGRGLRLAAIVNEFGELDVDGKLIQGELPVLELPGGCICCRAGDDVRRALSVLLRTGPGFDLVLVETSGLADPGPVAELLGEAAGVRLAEVVCLVDASRYDETLDQAEVAYAQITAADRLAVTKTDLVPASVPPRIAEGLRRLNADAPIATGPRSEIASEILAGLSRPLVPRRRRFRALGHDATFEAATLVADRPLVPERFEAWWAALPPSVLRAKGFVQLSGRAQEVVHAVGVQRGRETPAGGRTPPPGSRIVVLGRDLPVATLQADFQACMEEPRS